LNSENTRQAAAKLKEEFRNKRIGMHKEFRELTIEQTAPSCEEMHKQLVAVRLIYVGKLMKLRELC